MGLPAVDSQYLLHFLTGLLNTPSPTGFADQAVLYVGLAMQEFPVHLSRTRKGALVVTWPGRRNDAPRGLTAHVDTLGAMVREIKPNGRLKLTKIGGFAWNTVEGEGCTIYTRKSQALRGSLLLTKASAHIHGKDVQDTPRDDEHMEVRLDERTASPEQTRALGIEVGDFVAFDPRVEVTNGFVRSRHLDDKACVACIVAAFKALKDAGTTPLQTVHALISNYEEVGHGAAAGFPPKMAELLAVDMAAVGEGQTSDEFHTSLCVKDAGGPYHHGMSQRLRLMADDEQIPYKIDIYTHYHSDGEAYWNAGGDVAVALIGPGVDASHSYERTHLDALEDTTRWILAYLLGE